MPDYSNESVESIREKLKAFDILKNKQKPVPTEQDIAELEKVSGRSFPDALKDMWLNFSLLNIDCISADVKNRYNIEFTDLDMYLDANLPAEFIKYLNAKSNWDGQLYGLGILNYINKLWGNDQPFLNRVGIFEHVNEVPANKDFGSFYEEIDISPEQLQKADNALTCFAHIGDDHCEGHIVLHYDNDGIFGATLWEQDEAHIPFEPSITGFKTPEALILKLLQSCNELYAHPEQEEPECPNVTVRLLMQWITTGHVYF